MKYQWRKSDKDLYLPKAVPTFIQVPPMNYLTVTGQGNPNGDEFSSHIESLYALSYGLKMLPKKGKTPDGYFDYTVFPLEGYWSLTEEGIEMYHRGKAIKDLKDFFSYKIMIRQPEFIHKDLVEEVRHTVMKKKSNPWIEKLAFESIREGKSVQMLHLGSYDLEAESFQLMEDFCLEKGWKRLDKNHKEIYLSDARKVPVEKLKTTLRFALE